jgi:UDPglucose--hexose-1-phosphate uridylyltransferase
MTELRRDPVVGRWVIISTERGKRPSDFGKEVETGVGKFCPFCPGNEDKTPAEILAYHEPGREKNAPGWWVRVVPNKFPALQIEGALNRQGEGMYDKMNGVGAHEVVIESADHATDFPDLRDKRAEDVVWAFRDRLMDLKKDARFEYILIFKNKGAAAGASLSHPHSQLIATPVVPKHVRELMNGAKNYFEYKERCVFCDMIKQEISTGTRVVAENDDFVAFVPFAACYPFEVWVLPKVHDSDFEDVQKHEVVNLTRMLQLVLRRLKDVLDDPPYNFIILNSPLRESKLVHYHWHLEIMPKLTKVAGFEWGSGFYINPTPPEEAAKFLREAD